MREGPSARWDASPPHQKCHHPPNRLWNERTVAQIGSPILASCSFAHCAAGSNAYVANLYGGGGRVNRETKNQARSTVQKL